jgi:hypothetical protein
MLKASLQKKHFQKIAYIGLTAIAYIGCIFFSSPQRPALMESRPMNAAQLQGFRELAAAMQPEGPRFELLDAQGRVVMFDLTRERAEQYRTLHRGATVREQQ